MAENNEKNLEAAAETAAGAKKAKPKTVKFRLFKDNDRYKSDVFVGVNGKGYIIKRGVEVTMPVSVYEVLRNKERQEGLAIEVMEKAELKEEK